MASNTMKPKSKTARAASALKTGVVYAGYYAGSAMVSAVNGITPHLAGAVDMMVVQQPDGSLKCSPFYVRFGKYTPLLSKDRIVKIFVNDEEASFRMVLGKYGQAYFAHEVEVVSDDQEDCMSPLSGNSSDEDVPSLISADLRKVSSSISSIDINCQSPPAHSVLNNYYSEPVTKPNAARKLLPETPSLANYQSMVPETVSAISPPSPPSPPTISEFEIATLTLDAAAAAAEGVLQPCSLSLQQDSPSKPQPLQSTLRGTLKAPSETSASAPTSPFPGCDSTSPFASIPLITIPNSTHAHAPSASITIAGRQAPPTPLSSQTADDPLESESSPYGVSPVSDSDIDRYISPVAAAVAVSASGGNTPLSGIELSICAHVLTPETPYADAISTFDKHKVSADMFAVHGCEIAALPNLACRIAGVVYPWSAVAPLIMGVVVFGMRWDHLIPANTQCWAPDLGVKDMPDDKLSKVPAPPSRKGRLWPFGWRSSRVPPINTEVPTSDVVSVLSSNLSESLPTTPTGLQSIQTPRKPKVVMKKTLSPTSEQLATLTLKDGQNKVVFRVGNSTELTAYMYFIQWDTKIVISDVDGTITRSDVLGHLLPAIGFDWSHYGISKLFCNIESNGYMIMYLSSRAIAQASITRDFLNSLVQDNHKMPVGPVIISPQGLLPSLYREMILRRPHEFKIAALSDIKALFPEGSNPFYAGFGNRDTDELSYMEVGVPANRVFIINPKGELRKPLSSSDHTKGDIIATSSLHDINDVVSDIFPAIFTDPQESHDHALSDVIDVSDVARVGTLIADVVQHQGVGLPQLVYAPKEVSEVQAECVTLCELAQEDIGAGIEPAVSMSVQVPVSVAAE